MSQAVSPSANKAYGLMRVCRVWDIARSTFYWQRQHKSKQRKKPGPTGPCSDEKLVEHIKEALVSSPFHAEGYRKVWARLRFGNIRTSPRRVLRLMRDNSLLVPLRQKHARGPKAHDGTIKTQRVDEMWGTDMTSTFTRIEGQACIFVAVDHCSGECLGIHATNRGTRFEALEPIRQAIRHCFGAFSEKIAIGLKLRHDHGSQYMSNTFQEEMSFLGIESSPAFVREPEGNGCAERFIRTLKENLLWVKSFSGIEDLRLALLDFKKQYNESWILGRHGYKTPAQVRHEQINLLSMAA